MIRTFVSVSLAMMACTGAQAATTNTVLTVTSAAVTIGTTISVTGPATLTNIGNGTFSATVNPNSLTGTTVTAPFTITLSGGTLTGTLAIPLSLITGGGTSATGSATVTGGTGSYAGATGSFPSVSGTGSISGATITATFTGSGSITTGAGGGPTGPAGPPAPTVTAVQDAASYTSNVAQGSIFVVKGTNMSASGLNQFSFPLPITSGGVKITFTPTAGGSGTDAYLVYTFNQGGVNQLAGILPSTVATGSYNVTVTNNGSVSAPFATVVVQRKIGLITQDSSGSGLAVVQNFISGGRLDVNRFTTNTISGTTISPAKPGQVLIAWATGMGPVTGGDNTASPGFNFAANGVNVQVIVGGVSITPAYAGRAPGLAGADQINFTLPANVPTGCTISFQVSVNGAVSNPAFIAIAPDAASAACVVPGFTTAQLQNFDQGGKYTVGSFSLSQISETVPSFGNVKLNTASGVFTQISGFQLASGAGQTSLITSPGACQVFHSTSQAGGSTATGITLTNLDAGVVTLNGPSGSNISNQAYKQDPTSNTYSLALASEGLPAIPGVTGGTGTIVAGTYTLSGAGGKDVGKFNASVNLGAPLTITGGLPSTVTRSAGLTLNWTGGLPSDLVEIVGSSSTATGTGSSQVVDVWSFICITTAGPGTFTVPASILNQLPAAAVNSTGLGGGFLSVFSTINPTSGNGLFTAPLTAGGSIDAGFFIPLAGTGGSAVFQ